MCVCVFIRVSVRALCVCVCVFIRVSVRACVYGRSRALHTNCMYLPSKDVPFTPATAAVAAAAVPTKSPKQPRNVNINTIQANAGQTTREVWRGGTGIYF